MSGEPFLARVMTIFIKTCTLQRLNWVTTTVEKSIDNYVEWYFQRAQRLSFSRLYAGIMIIHCIYWFHTLDTPLRTQTHTQACGGGGGGGGGGGRGSGGSGGGRGGGHGGSAGGRGEGAAAVTTATAATTANTTAATATTTATTARLCVRLRL